MWYFLSFSYSSVAKRAVAFLARYGAGGLVRRKAIPCLHAPPFFLHLVIGGRHLERYSGINGQFANIFYDVDAPALIDTEEQLHQAIKERSNQPQALPTQVDLEVVAEPRVFDGNSNTNQWAESKESAMVLEEYAVSLWLRWTDDLEVSEETQFQVMSLRSNKQRLRKLGDNALESRFTFGGSNQGALLVNTYTTFGHAGKGTPYVSRQVKCPNHIWTYLYVGYSHDRTSLYAAVIQPALAQEIQLKRISHKLTNRLYFTVGYEENTVASFNGRIAFCTLYIGPESYREGLSFFETFSFGRGAMNLFQLLKPIVVSDEVQGEPNRLRETRADDPMPVFESILLHDDSECRINGQSEYSFSLWTRWLRSAPAFLAQRSQLHSIARFGTQHRPLARDIQGKVHRTQDRPPHPKDTTLSVNLGLGSYQFVTLGATGSLAYSSLEGEWVFLQFGYKRSLSLARGFVHYYSLAQETSSLDLHSEHDHIIDYAELVIAKSNIPLFNGLLARVTFTIGQGAFIEDKQQLILLAKVDSLPDAAVALTSPVRRSTLSLQSEPLSVTELGPAYSSGRKESTQTSFDFKQSFQGAEEYSLSGWVRWTGPQSGAKDSAIVLLAQKQLSELKGDNSLGEQTLLIARNDANFRFITYTCNVADQCTRDIVSERPFHDYWDQWTFLYFGYNKKNAQAYGLLKFTFTTEEFRQTGISHFFLSTFSIQLAAIKGWQSWLGNLKTWVANFGPGSFREGDFEQNESIKVHFGLTAGSDHVKLQSAAQEAHRNEQILECTPEQPPLTAEFKQGDKVHLQGVTEYGYGFWSRFQMHTAALRIVAKPPLMGMAKLANQKDSTDPMSRVLGVLLGKGTYRFTTYSSKVPEVAAELKYLADMEGSWVYLYFSYKQFSPTQGSAVAFSCHSTELINGAQLQVLHRPLADYLLLTVGHAGKNYPNFNGQIAKVRFNLGPGAFIDKKAAVLEKLASKDPQPQMPALNPVSTTLFRKPLDFAGKDTAPKAMPLQDASNQKEYAISVWFRWNQVASASKSQNPRQVVFRLTSNPEDAVSDSQKPGDRVLFLSHNVKQAEFSSYTMLPEDESKTLAYQCDLPTPNLELWTFVYQAFKNNQMQYFLRSESHTCSGNEKLIHLTPFQLTLFLASDNLLDKFLGKIALLQINLGQGYQSENLDQLWTQSASIFTSNTKQSFERRKHDLIWLDDDAVVEERFEDGGEFQLESVTEYALGFWSRYLTAFPSRLIIKPAIAQIAKVASQQTGSEYLFAAHLSFQRYIFSTVSQDGKPAETELPFEELEGKWRFIWLGYNRQNLLFTASTFEGDGVIATKSITEILHRPLNDYLSLTLGKDTTTTNAFHGLVTGVILQIGPGAFLTSPEQLKLWAGSTAALPIELTETTLRAKKRENIDLIGEPSSQGQDLSGTTWAGAEEYSVQGWLKITSADKECQTIFRATNNEPNHQADKATQGDRTLYAELCDMNTIRVSTYTLLGLRDFNEARHLEGKLDLGQLAKSWAYFYMGYSNQEKQVTCVLHIPMATKDQTLAIKSVQHIVPNYIGLYLGKDKFGRKFTGQLQKWSASHGNGAFAQVARKGFEQSLQYYTAVKTDTKHTWSLPGKSITTAVDQVFMDEVESATEYAVAMWTRWTHYLPTRLLERSNFHQAFRLTTNRQYSDASDPGDRTLAAFVAKGYYSFSTYDLNTKEPNLEAKLPYASHFFKTEYLFFR